VDVPIYVNLHHNFPVFADDRQSSIVHVMMQSRKVEIVNVIWESETDADEEALRRAFRVLLKEPEDGGVDKSTCLFPKKEPSSRLP
jgi:hypothetical protein